MINILLKLHQSSDVWLNCLFDWVVLFLASIIRLLNENVNNVLWASRELMNKRSNPPAAFRLRAQRSEVALGDPDQFNLQRNAPRSHFLLRSAHKHKDPKHGKSWTLDKPDWRFWASYFPSLLLEKKTASLWISSRTRSCQPALTEQTLWHKPASTLTDTWCPTTNQGRGLVETQRRRSLNEVTCVWVCVCV